jgi:N-acetylmuramic acid 6-phosphate etherase
LDIVKQINREDASVATVVADAAESIAAAAEMFAETLRHGNRVFYIGAGTSGRLGVLDAAECPPTFGTDPSQIVGVIAGGHDTLVLSREGVEDDETAAIADLNAHRLQGDDLVIGIAASARTPYTLAGLRHAHGIGSRTVLVVCNRLSDQLPFVDLLVELPVGPEVITGSTRMKSGTAQKLTLNSISTTAMVLLGKTYGNLMVDLQVRSQKLAARSRMILQSLFDIQLAEADILLKEAGGSVKAAIVMKQHHCSLAKARERLETAEGFVRRCR